jgi:cation diffusion facilitator CzcD-associated flavoprotein CzcO
MSLAPEDNARMAVPDHVGGAARRDGGHVPLLVIGAGPYGLSTAAHAKRHGIEPLVVGEAMGFWRRNMPVGMLLRSGTDWHLDAAGVATFEAYLVERGIDPSTVPPVPLRTFIEYADWFCARNGIEPQLTLVTALAKADASFQADFEDGSRMTADAVVAAPGIARFPVIPKWVPASLPEPRWSHTSVLVRFDRLRDARVLIVGGRQSAFEWAALLAEARAARVHVVHRHDLPRFEVSDWTFVDQLMDDTVRVPGWFRRLPASERDAIAQRFWGEGRLKLEPWLTARLPEGVVHPWPRTDVASARELPSGEIDVELSSGERLRVDHVVLATGYRPNLANVPYLRPLLDRIDTTDGFPALDEHFQTSVPGLFMPGFVSTRDFGPFFGFVRGCPAAATLIVAGLRARLGRPVATRAAAGETRS